MPPLEETDGGAAPAGALAELLRTQFGAAVQASADGLALRIESAEWLAAAHRLRDAREFAFAMLIDVAGLDLLEYGRTEWRTQAATASGFSRGVQQSDSPAAGEADAGRSRFRVVYQLLSIAYNRRLTVHVDCEGGDEPVVDSVCEVWASANWFEREAFDLFGIAFRGHPDLRRILTDYGFVGHPFRKDFPLIGNVEVRYDEQQKRVVYEPVTIEPRTLVPRVIRDDNRYDPALKHPPAARS